LFERGGLVEKGHYHLTPEGRGHGDRGVGKSGGHMSVEGRETEGIWQREKVFKRLLKGSQRTGDLRHREGVQRKGPELRVLILTTRIKR